MNDRQKERDEETGRETKRVCDYTLTLTHTHAYMMNPPLDSVHDYWHRYDW